MAQMNQQWIAGQYAYAQTDAQGQVHGYYVATAATAAVPGVNYYDYSQYYAHTYPTGEATAHGKRK